MGKKKAKLVCEELIDLYQRWKYITEYVFSKGRDILAQQMFVQMFENDFKTDMRKLLAEDESFSMRDWEKLSKFFYEENALVQEFSSELLELYKRLMERASRPEERFKIFFDYLWFFNPVRVSDDVPGYSEAMLQQSLDFERLVKEIKSLECVWDVDCKDYLALFVNFANNKSIAGRDRFLDNVPCVQLEAFENILRYRHRKEVLQILQTDWFVEMVLGAELVEERLVLLLKMVMEVYLDNAKEQALRKDLLEKWKNRGVFDHFGSLQAAIREIFADYAAVGAYPDIYMLRLKDMF